MRTKQSGHRAKGSNVSSKFGIECRCEKYSYQKGFRSYGAKPDTTQIPSTLTKWFPASGIYDVSGLERFMKKNLTLLPVMIFKYTVAVDAVVVHSW